MTDTQAYIQRLLEANPIREPVLRAVIQSLELSPGSHGLDVGCGIGLQAQRLAEAVGPTGHITALDLLPELLDYGAQLAAQAGLSGRITFRKGDMRDLPFADASFDWAWSADCIGYPAGELAPLLAELQRVVRPGGGIYLLAWTSQQVLPGYPLLEARLNAACSSYQPYLQGQAPERHFLRAPFGLAQAGLEGIRAQTFVGEVQAPLRVAERAALVGLFEMLWNAAEALPEDRAALQRLCRPDASECILDQPGYYAFFTYTLFSARLPGQPHFTPAGNTKNQQQTDFAVK
jgi:demethylmenaquinone methyltransferase/2-methoxy-6-polyprenyl-1,4-benzoquinol methylase